MVSWVWVAFGVVAVQRLSELVIARRNRAWALAKGAVEHSPGHYPLFFVLHIGWLLGWLIEAHWRGAEISPLWPLWLSLFATGQVLRYWCMVSLGRYWNTRILVIPGAPRIKRGPYRWLPHPNYLAVALELLSVPLLFNAWVTAGLASLFNAVILLGIRIPAEERALQNLETETDDKSPDI